MEFLSVLFIYPNSNDPPAAWDTALFAVVTFATAAAAALSVYSRMQARSAERSSADA